MFRWTYVFTCYSWLLVSMKLQCHTVPVKSIQSVVCSFHVQHPKTLLNQGTSIYHRRGVGCEHNYTLWPVSFYLTYLTSTLLIIEMINTFDGWPMYIRTRLRVTWTFYNVKLQIKSFLCVTLTLIRKEVGK